MRTLVTGADTTDDRGELGLDPSVACHAGIRQVTGEAYAQPRAR
jgi:hypothetical protein